jgi:hypothetical protein
LTDYLGSYDELHKKSFLKARKIGYLNTIIKEDVPWTDLVRENDEGWIVLTEYSRVGRNGLDFNNFKIDQKMVYYLGRWGDCYIWHWIDSH